jgi:ABC-2 type transport system permease protein
MFINPLRISAIVYRHMKPTMRDPMRLMDMFYWPLLDIVLWGFTAVWLGTVNPNQPKATLMLLSALVLWQVVFRSSIEVTRNFLEELWHHNFINLFASPLKSSEWLLALLLISLINSLWNLLFGSFMVYLFFGVNILYLGFWIAPFFIVLAMFGWFCGMMSCSVVFNFGRRSEVIAWSFPWFFSTFSCVFYPLDVLPAKIQIVAKFIPCTAIFENVRLVAMGHQVDIFLYLRGLGLAIVFLCCSLATLAYFFDRALTRGLNTLD